MRNFKHKVLTGGIINTFTIVLRGPHGRSEYCAVKWKDYGLKYWRFEQKIIVKCRDGRSIIFAIYF